MARTTTSDVKSIINTAIDDSIVTLAISTATNLVDDLLLGKGLNAARLKDIELYLAAHFVAIRDQDAGMLVEQAIDGTSSKYGGELGQALAITRYGQQAMALDITGELTSVGKTRAQFRAF